MSLGKEHRRAYQREWRKKQIKMGICLRCGKKNRSNPAGTNCLACARVIRNRYKPVNQWTIERRKDMDVTPRMKRPCPLEGVEVGDTVYTPVGKPRIVRRVIVESGRLKTITLDRMDPTKGLVTYVRSDVRYWSRNPPDAPAEQPVDTVSQAECEKASGL